MNPNSPLSGILYIKFDDPNAGNGRKNSQLPLHLRDCVPIKSIVKPFSFSKGRGRYATVERKQYPGTLAFGITIHKSQGSTYHYMKGDLDQTSKGKRPTTVKQGQAYTLLSRAISRDGIKLTNFKPEMIKVNQAALEEMQRLREKAPLQCTHPLDFCSDFKFALLNIRSWNYHLKHFLSDPVLLAKCCMFVFTETNIANNAQDSITNYDSKWTDIHVHTQHGLA